MSFGSACIDQSPRRPFRRFPSGCRVCFVTKSFRPLNHVGHSPCQNLRIAQQLSSRDPTRTLPPKHLGPSKFIRQWIGLSAVGETVECEPFHPSNGDWAASVELEVNEFDTAINVTALSDFRLASGSSAKRLQIFSTAKTWLLPSSA